MHQRKWALLSLSGGSVWTFYLNPFS
jgi:hypothetical protein